MPAIFAIALGLSFFLPALRAETPAATGKKSLVFLGDSLTAGLGVQSGEAFPSLVAEKISAAGLPFDVENAGLSGDTTAIRASYADQLANPAAFSYNSLMLAAVSAARANQNKDAIKLYEQVGFRSRGVRRGYYTDNREDALIMWRDPEPATRSATG